MMLEIPSYNAVQAPYQDLLRIKDNIEIVKTYPAKPNSRTALFVDDDDVFYIIATDTNGYKSEIRRFRFVEEPIETQNGSYASKEDFNMLKEELGNVQQSIQQLTEAISNKRPNNSRKYRSNSHNGPETRSVEATIVDG
jgi:hypothetical protein